MPTSRPPQSCRRRISSFPMRFSSFSSPPPLNRKLANWALSSLAISQWWWSPPRPRRRQHRIQRRPRRTGGASGRIGSSCSLGAEVDSALGWLRACQQDQHQSETGKEKDDADQECNGQVAIKIIIGRLLWFVLGNCLRHLFERVCHTGPPKA